MQIDLKVPGQLTVDAVVKLLQSKDDSQHRQVRVNKSGIVFLSDEVGARNIEGLATRFETWTAGGNYTGDQVEAGDPHVLWVYRELLTWPKFKDTYIDY